MRLPLLVFSLFISLSVSAESFRGFLLTKDNHRLTGYVNQINFVITGLQMEFTNDFGDRYSIHPNLIKGFGYTHEGETYRYVSRYYQGRWYFMELVDKSRQFEFYRLPDRNQGWVDDRLLSLLSEPIPEYWLQIKGQPMQGISRAGFRRTLREYLKPTAPELAKKIGNKGYRYRDLPKIIEAYRANKERLLKRL